MKEINEIEILTKSPEWLEVENRFKKKISELLDIREVKEFLSSEDMKIEIRARQLAVEKFIEFLHENSFSRMRTSDIDVTFE